MQTTRRAKNITDAPASTDEDTKQGVKKPSFFQNRKVIKVAALLISLFFTSISLTSLLKYTISFSSYKFPLIFLSVQMAISALMSGIIVNIFIKRRPNFFSFTLWRKILIVGALTGLDFGFSNMSFRFNSVSFYTMVKSAVPMVVLIIGFLTRLEEPKTILVISIVCTTVGVCMAVVGNPVLNYTGLALLLIATVCTGIRVILSQHYLQHKGGSEEASEEAQYSKVSTTDTDNSEEAPNGTSTELTTIVVGAEDIESADIAKPSTDSSSSVEKESISSPTPALAENPEADDDKPHKLNTLDVYFHISPTVSLVVMPFALMLEGASFAAAFNAAGAGAPVGTIISEGQWIYLGKGLLLIMLIAVVALILNVIEYLLIRETSGLTLSVSGVARELVLIAVGTLVFGDHLNVLNTVGYFVCLAGIGMYKYDRLTKFANSSNVKEKKEERAEE